MKNIFEKIKRIILNPTKKELIFLCVFAILFLALFIFVLASLNGTPIVKKDDSSNPSTEKEKSKPSVSPTEKPEPTSGSVKSTNKVPSKIASPTRAPTFTPYPTSKPIATSTPTVVPSMTSTPTPSRNPDPPKMKINYPSEGQAIEITTSQTFCVDDIPDGGDQAGLKRKQNINTSGWTSYDNMTTLCFDPIEGSNKLELQYKNAFNEESPSYTVNFTFHRTN